MSLANISIVGNLVRPPDQVSFQTGRVKTTFTVAVNSYIKDKNATDYYKVETWGKLAELAGKYLQKGHQVTVSGRLRMEQFVDNNQMPRVIPVVKAEQLSFPPKPKSFLQEAPRPSLPVAMQSQTVSEQQSQVAPPESMTSQSMPPQPMTEPIPIHPSPQLTEQQVIDAETIAAQFDATHKEMSLAQAS